MTTSTPNRLLLVALLVGACSHAGSRSGADATAPTDTPPAATPTQLTHRAAEAICASLFRCCTNDLVDYFAPFRNNERLAAFVNRLPPTATLDEAGCRAVLEPMLDIVPLGDWVAAATRGEVTYDSTAASACLAALDHAACGAPARAALWDSTCFGFAPPGGGTEQRSVFKRTHGAGAMCSPIRDGIGAAFYGTCDPGVGFCCYEDPAHPGCQYPYQANGTARPGHCSSVAAVNQTCSTTAPVVLCATGDDCDSDTLKCVAPTTATLESGATCVDAGYHLLGACRDSYCDVLGSKKCEQLRVDGQACTAAESCRSGHCATVCMPNNLCTGAPDPVLPDAGVPDARPIDASIDASIDAPLDAPIDAVVAATRETCGTAGSLLGASVASPLPGYSSRVTAAFGATNDYNPLSTSGLPPHCSVVYDARGHEVVYAAELAPGDRLRLHAELADGKQPAIYLLDTCPGASWPDFDLTGSCGSNEYNVGFCGPVGCDAAHLDIRYPLTLGGQPTVTRTFWIVVDQVGGDDSTGFVLDWKLDHI